MDMLSPGINARETTNQNTVVRNATGRAALVGKFNWGPVMQVSQVANEPDLVSRFGRPDNQTYSYVMSAINFLQDGDDLRLVRVVDPVVARNSSALYQRIKTEVTAAGTGYSVGDAVSITYNGEAFETGKVTDVDTDGKVLNLFIPSEKIVAKMIETGNYPALGGDWALTVSTVSGGAGAAVSMVEIVTDSGVMVPNVELSDDVLTSTNVQQAFADAQLPVVCAIYPGEIDLEVEIVSKAAFDGNLPQTIYPGGGTRAASAASVVPYGPMTDDQYLFIVRRNGIVEDNFVLSTKPNERNVYGTNIFMDAFFMRGTSALITATSVGWPKGFSGILTLSGGASGNEQVTASELTQGWDLFADKESLKVNTLIAGAVAVESDEISATVQKYVSAIGDARQDCLVANSPTRSLLVNVPLATAVENIVAWRKGRTASGAEVENNLNINSTYSFFDGNFKYQYDKYNDVNRWVPLAGDIAGLCARTDKQAAPWKSIAGFNRGQLLNCIKLAIEPKQPQRDVMYQSAINPVVGFDGGEGYILYGDKTATSVPSPFDRVNVRRLMNMLKINISGTSKYKLFENNDEFTRNSFRTEVGAYLERIRSLGGLLDFRVICDSTNNPASVIDRNEFHADIWVKPPRSINYINLNFIAAATGTDFDEIIGPANI